MQVAVTAKDLRRAEEDPYGMRGLHILKPCTVEEEMRCHKCGLSPIHVSCWWRHAVVCMHAEEKTMLSFLGNTVDCFSCKPQASDASTLEFAINTGRNPAVLPRRFQYS